MSRFSIGIILDSFRKPFPEALKLTSQLGAQGIQVYATSGEMAPENLVGSNTALTCRISFLFSHSA